jgi:predicted nucleic acid-binding protein
MPSLTLVLDSGILLTTAREVPYKKESRALLDSITAHNIMVIAPILFHYEIIAVLRMWVHRGLTEAQYAPDILRKLLDFPVTTYFDMALARRAYALATRHNRPTAYDSQYHALAERFNCQFWTADQKYYNALHAHEPRVQFIGTDQPDWTS